MDPGPSSHAMPPERRLAASRARLRARLTENGGRDGRLAGARDNARDKARDNAKDTAMDAASGFGASLLGEIATPVARDLVRRHPYAMLAGAALSGALLVWWKPWRLAGSLLIGSLARNAGAASLDFALRSAGRLLEEEPPPAAAEAESMPEAESEPGVDPGSRAKP